MKSPEKVAQHITKWLSTYVENASMNGFVVGVSGGIDSAVTSTLCAKTKKKVLCLEMPIKQDVGQISRSQNHINWLKSNFKNVSSQTLPLDSVFESFKQLIPETNDKEGQFLSLANTKARLRMTSLYYFASLNGCLVVGTGNKVEDFGVGFYTKYGDGGVDMSPIADLMKTEVFSLASYLEIIESIQKASPTDGLWGDNRTDEDQLGATYPELEWAMSALKNGVPTKDFTEREKEVFEIYHKHHLQNQHKMNPIPICKIPKGFV
ncbi:MAG: NAD+ synthase [Flavobacteriaceae bacterium]|jgi:NAD+ synthase